MQAPQTLETTITIATHKFISAHPEIYHYTTYSGLQGIVGSNTLWATHFAELNDTTEITLLKKPLSKAVNLHFREVLRKKQRERYSIKRQVQKYGGLLKSAEFVANDFVEIMYKSIFRDSRSTIYLEPFITSFCSHAPDSYESNNGLLSQWRGYGRGGGYCIVFDTNALAHLLHQESSKHFYAHISIDEVQYAIKEKSLDSLFPQLLGRCDLFLEQCLEHGGYRDIGEDGLSPLLSATSLYKHESFKEEKEVRIVVMPGAPQLLETGKREHPEHPFGDLKKIYPRSGENPRHVSLFETLGAVLPIKRVIVGPSRNQEDNLKQAEALLHGKFSLHPSETPYIEQAS